MCGCKGKCGCNITSTTKGEKGDASPVASLGYKTYVANLTQSSTNAPVATVLENTLGGNLVWTRFGSGTYLATLNGAFSNASKIWLSPIIPPVPNLAYMQYSDANSIQLNTTDPSFGNIDDVLNLSTSIEIRVYP
jgi:hypothetical protein